MQLQKSERPHIAFFGCTNSGKSSLVNAIVNQNLSIVSDIKGTTTDSVSKSMEILPLGPVVIIDTAGVNDLSELGEQRTQKTKEVLDKTDIAVLVIDSTVGENEFDKNLISEFEARKIPYLVVWNKSDLIKSPPLEGGGRGWGKTASHKFSKNVQSNAIELRNNATKQEKKLWQYLNKSQLGYKFRRQQPIDKYIVDFFCPKLRLIIELDGGQHNEEKNKNYDENRTEILNRLGYKVLRIWNNDIDKNIEGVIEYIKRNLTPPPSSALIARSDNTIIENSYVRSTPLPQGAGVVHVSALTGEGINELKEKIGHLINDNKKEKFIIKDRLQTGDIVIMVIPIDESAPKGRIILPQQNTLREILDAHATAVCCGVNELEDILKKVTPKYVITDSQAFNEVKKIVPENIILTSFSILMANYKGELDILVNGAKKISELNDGDKVLISEGCTHHRQCNDIGTVKLPNWIKKYTNKNLDFEFTQGGEFPQDLSKFSLIVHCGGCMLNEAEMKSRLKKANEQNIPIVNYGMAIAYMNGILERSLEIFE